MKSIILEKKINPLLKREEVIMEIESNSTPSFTEVSKIASQELKSAEDALKIKKIEGKFGTAKFKIYVNVYKTKEDLEKTERKPKEKKAGAEKKPAEEKK